MMANEDVPATIRGLYMDDFKRRIDFVLAYTLPPPELDPMRTNAGTPVKRPEQPAPSSSAANDGASGTHAIELQPLWNAGGSASATNPNAQPPGFFARMFRCRKETKSELDTETLERHIGVDVYSRRTFEAQEFSSSTLIVRFALQ